MLQVLTQPILAPINHLLTPLLVLQISSVDYFALPPRGCASQTGFQATLVLQALRRPILAPIDQTLTLPLVLQISSVDYVYSDGQAVQSSRLASYSGADFDSYSTPIDQTSTLPLVLQISSVDYVYSNGQDSRLLWCSWSRC